MDQIIINDLNNDNLNELNDTSFVLVYYDSFGNISNIKNLNYLNKLVNIGRLENLIKKKINTYNFKTLFNRKYLPIANSIYLNYDKINIIYVPIMWINQDVSNTNNLYNAYVSVLLHLYKIKQILGIKSKLKLFINKLSNIKDDYHLNKAIDYCQDYLNENKNFFLETLDYKEDINIFLGNFNINEQPPIYQNNEFRELNYT